MKIAEFREKIKQADRANLETMAAELYKMIPKNVKDNGLDLDIEEILISGKKPSKNPAPTISFDELEKELNLFLDYAREGLYFAPNKIVPKSKRSKWRFEVKRFVKQLDSITVDDPNLLGAAKLYNSLYHTLCYGCGYYIFPTEDPFRSIGIPQVDFYERLLTKYFANGYSKEKIKDMLQAATIVYLDHNTLHIELQFTLISKLKTPDTKELALETAKEMVTELQSNLCAKKRDDDTYALKEYISELCSVILGLSIVLSEGTSGVEYYMQNVRNYDREIVLYKALNIIEVYSQNHKLWIETYEKYTAKGIIPRNTLVAKYNEFRNMI